MTTNPKELQRKWYNEWAKRNPEKIKAHNKKYQSKRYWFKGKRLLAKEDLRKGVCSKCGKKGRTSLHHLEYDGNNPLYHTIEICQGCHIREHGYLLEYQGRNQ